MDPSPQFIDASQVTTVMQNSPFLAPFFAGVLGAALIQVITIISTEQIITGSKG
jgi:hypothetical protein